mmetsp:Transcript_103108/g.287724  ORF Transcript_103108/g.287724 Transcript_103108/m.287724 type:complete len:257 (-) Transcript_103108:5-775(-)
MGPKSSAIAAAPVGTLLRVYPYGVPSRYAPECTLTKRSGRSSWASACSNCDSGSENPRGPGFISSPGTSCTASRCWSPQFLLRSTPSSLVRLHHAPDSTCLLPSGLALGTMTNSTDCSVRFASSADSPWPQRACSRPRADSAVISSRACSLKTSIALAFLPPPPAPTRTTSMSTSWPAASAVFIFERVSRRRPSQLCDSPRSWSRISSVEWYQGILSLTGGPMFLSLLAVTWDSHTKGHSRAASRIGRPLRSAALG